MSPNGVVIGATEKPDGRTKRGRRQKSAGRYLWGNRAVLPAGLFGSEAGGTAMAMATRPLHHVGVSSPTAGSGEEWSSSTLQVDGENAVPRRPCSIVERETAEGSDHVPPHDRNTAAVLVG